MRANNPNSNRLYPKGKLTMSITAFLPRASHRSCRAFAVLLIGLLCSGVRPAHADGFTEADSSVKKGPKVYGYIQFHVLNQPIDTNGDGEVNEGRFRVHRARVSFEGRVNRYVTYEMDIDPRSPDISGVMRDAFFDIEYRKNHVLRLGQQKTKFGYENQVSSSRLYMVNRAEMADEVARGVTLRDLGVSLLGKWKLGEDSRFEYALSVVNGAGANVQRDNNKKKSLWGRVGLRGKRGDTKWRLGLSAAKADRQEPDEPPSEYMEFKSYGTDFLIDHKRLAVNGEFALSPREQGGEKETMHAYYLTLIGKTSKPFGPMARFDTINTDEYRRWTVGAYYGLPNDEVRVVFNYEFRYEEDDELDNGLDDRLYVWTQVRF